MRSLMFLGSVVCALAVACCAGEALLAKCRCNVSARRAAKQERKAARRGYCAPAYWQPAIDNSYPNAVQPVGQVEGWQCDGVRCRPVPVPDHVPRSIPPQAEPTPQAPPQTKATEAVKPYLPPLPQAFSGHDRADVPDV